MGSAGVSPYLLPQQLPWFMMGGSMGDVGPVTGSISCCCRAARLTGGCLFIQDLLFNECTSRKGFDCFQRKTVAFAVFHLSKTEEKLMKNPWKGSPLLGSTTALGVEQFTCSFRAPRHDFFFYLKMIFGCGVCVRSMHKPFVMWQIQISLLSLKSHFLSMTWECLTFPNATSYSPVLLTCFKIISLLF